jgi:hypothetical protein
MEEENFALERKKNLPLAGKDCRESPELQDQSQKPREL